VKVLKVDQYFYHLRKHSSAGKIAHKLTEFLSKYGVKVDLLTTDCDSQIKIDNCLKIYNFGTFKTYVFHVPRFFDALHLCLPLCCNKLKEVVSGYDLIHIHEYLSPINLLVINIAIKHRIPFIIQPHGAIIYPYVEKNVNLIYKITRITLDRLIGFKILDKVKAIFTMARVEEELLRSLGIHLKFIRIPNAIDPEEYEEFDAKISYGHFRKYLSIRDDEFLILYIGRKAPVKRLDLLITSIHRLRQKYDIARPVKLVIVGPSGSKYEERLKKLVKDLNLENHVIIHGPIYGSLKASAFKDANLFALVSKYETFPTVLLEAFFYRTPILATRVGIVAEEEISDKVIPLNPDPTPDEIAKKLYEIIEGKHDLKSLTEKAYRFLWENLTYEKVVPHIIRIYETIQNKNQELYDNL